MDEEILARMEIENNPVLKKIETNWNSMRVNYEIYTHNPLHATLDNELISDLDEIKEKFMKNLADQIKRYENDPLNTDMAVHATNSIPQGGDGWKKERIILMTASDIHDFSANENDPTAAINICKKKFGLGPSIDHLPAIKWGRKKENVAIKDFETAKGGKVTKTGLHISKEYPHFGKIAAQNSCFTCHLARAMYTTLQRQPLKSAHGLPSATAAARAAVAAASCCARDSSKDATIEVGFWLA